MSAASWVLNGAKTRDEIYDGILAALHALNAEEGFRFEQISEKEEEERVSVEFGSQVPARILARVDFDFAIDSAVMVVASRDAVVQAALRASVEEQVGIETVATLIAALEDNPTPRALYRFAASGQDWQDMRANAALVQALNADDPKMRRAGAVAAAMLGAVGLQDLLEVLALEDPSEDVRLAAQEALERLRSN